MDKWTIIRKTGQQNNQMDNLTTKTSRSCKPDKTTGQKSSFVLPQWRDPWSLLLLFLHVMPSSFSSVRTVQIHFERFPIDTCFCGSASISLAAVYSCDCTSFQLEPSTLHHPPLSRITAPRHRAPLSESSVVVSIHTVQLRESHGVTPPDVLVSCRVVRARDT